VAADVAGGTASFRVADVSTRDYTIVLNGIAQGPSSPATVSWEVTWDTPTGNVHLSDDKNRFRLDGVETKARMTWSAKGPGDFSFTGDPSSSNTVYALVAKERNGSFFGR